MAGLVIPLKKSLVPGHGRLGEKPLDSLDVVTEHFPVPLGAAFPETFATLTTTRHD